MKISNNIKRSVIMLAIGIPSIMLSMLADNHQWTIGYLTYILTLIVMEALGLIKIYIR